MNKPPVTDTTPAISAAAREPIARADAPSGESCPNCGSATWGEFCFACGQPRKGLIRRFTSIVGDFLDTVFSIDNRLLRTVVPLYLRPGHLTLEYIAGRRVRYVTPFRLFFFLCVLSFLALKFYAASDEGLHFNGGPGVARIETAQSEAEVDAALAAALEDLAKQSGGFTLNQNDEQQKLAEIKSNDEILNEDEAELRKAAAQRKAWLAEARRARAEGREPPPEPTDSFGEIKFFDDQPWDPQSNPVRIDWLPDLANEQINVRLARAREALRHGRENPAPLIEAFFGAIPPTTFVLIPLFALLLKVLYWFRRRLYMEHLLTALHSHAFIFLSLLLLVLTNWAGSRIDPARETLREATSWLSTVILWWVPLYLLLAQKRIYRQGWLMTILKFGVTAVAYSVLIAFGLALAILLGLFTL